MRVIININMLFVPYNVFKTAFMPLKEPSASRIASPEILQQGRLYCRHRVLNIMQACNAHTDIGYSGVPLLKSKWKLPSSIRMLLPIAPASVFTW
jgi:hypothetical protein